MNHPSHYVSHPSGIECIQITEHMGFNLGNALKYVWRADLKNNAAEDLRKAIWYIERELAKREASEPVVAEGLFTSAQTGGTTSTYQSESYFDTMRKVSENLRLFNAGMGI